MEVEFVQDPLSQAVELEKQLIQLREEKFPHQQIVNEINYKMEQIKSQIKIKNQEYWHQKG